MKGFAIGCGLALAILLTSIGYVMSLPEAGVSYGWPMWCSLLAVAGLPFGYATLVQTPPPWRAGLTGLAVMLVALIALAVPFAFDDALRAVHGGQMISWSLVWTVAAFPFIRTASKR